MLQPHSENESEYTKEQGKEANVPSVTDYLVGSLHEPVAVPSSPESPSSSSGDTPKQLVLYEPKGKGTKECQPIQSSRRSTPRFFSPCKTLPSIGAFTVQCASCFKWRVIPSKQKYEEIREHILQNPFFCETAREWRPDISCDDPTDLSQDGSRVWAIDKPNIAQPPPGWQRLLRIRGEGSTKFADVYYVAPSGQKFRSMVEVQKYLVEHPEHVTEGVTLSRFSFQIPRPLQENYVRKRPARVMDACDNTKAPDASEGMLHHSYFPLLPRVQIGQFSKPLKWIPPEDLKDYQLGRPGKPGLDPSRDQSSRKRRKSQPLTADLIGNTSEDQQKTGQSSDGS